MNKGLEQCDKCDYFISVEEAYKQGGADRAKEIFDKLHEFLSETRKEYGFTCMESRNDAITYFESWLFEQLKEQK